MKVYRLSRQKYIHDLSGKGAEMAGGRWNSIGIPVLYTSSSKALCLVEILVHLQADIIPDDYFIVELEIPDSVKFKSVEQSKLKENWKNFPWVNLTQKIGDEFIETNKDLVLKVPSAVVDDEHNFLINPKHKDFSKIKIVKSSAYNFDKRLFANKH